MSVKATQWWFWFKVLVVLSLITLPAAYYVTEQSNENIYHSTFGEIKSDY